MLPDQASARASEPRPLTFHIGYVAPGDASPRASQSRACAKLPAWKWARPPDIKVNVSSDGGWLRCKMSGIGAPPRLCQLVEGVGGHADGDVRAGPPLDQRSKQHLCAHALFLGRCGIPGNSSEDVLCARRLPFDAFEDPEEEVDVLPADPGRLRNLRDPSGDGGRFALFEHFGALAHDDVQCCVPVPGPKQILDAGVDLAPSEVPRRGSIEQTGFDVRLLRPQFEAQHVPEEVMEAKPLTRVSRGTRNIDSRSNSSRTNWGFGAPVR